MQIIQIAVLNVSITIELRGKGQQRILEDIEKVGKSSDKGLESQFR